MSRITIIQSLCSLRYITDFQINHKICVDEINMYSDITFINKIYQLSKTISSSVEISKQYHVGHSIFNP